MSGHVYVGIDAGSSATKCVVLRAEENTSDIVVGHAVAASGFDYTKASVQVLHDALGEAGAAEHEITACVATGYGRGSVQVSDSVHLRRLTEITCHARGAREWYPDVRHVIDIGGQDTKVIRLCDRGRMADYRMNAKCAAGTGTFLESIAVRMGLALTEIDALAMRSTARVTLNSYCTVFTSTEVLERIKSGDAKEDIAMGMFRAIASRVVEMISTSGGDGPVAATGGVVTYCRAMQRALEEALERPVHRPPLPQHAGAYGAALLAREGFAEGAGHVRSELVVPHRTAEDASCECDCDRAGPAAGLSVGETDALQGKVRPC